jgi:hypothetical protein
MARDVFSRWMYPFNVAQFKAEIWPALQSTCGTAGCHLAPGGQGGYNVWPATGAECPDVQSFNAFYSHVDFRIHPANSVLLRNMDGTDPHPVPYADSSLLADLRALVQAAYREYTGGGGDQAGYRRRHPAERPPGARAPERGGI